MSSRRVALTILVIAFLVACRAGVPGGHWSGANVHLVDGTWISTETDCGAADAKSEYRVVLNAGLQAVAPRRSQVTKAVVAALPTAYVTTTGEQRFARLAAGVDTLTAIVVDLTDGSRHVTILLCYIPYSSGGRLSASRVECATTALDWWRDGNAPPYPPGTTFG